MAGTPSPEGVSTRLQRIAELARTARDMAFTALAHHIDIELLREAYRRTRKDGAVGVDGQTAEEYAANLEEHLQRLLDRFKSGTYQAPPVRRVHIPKGDGTKTRPIGIPTFEYPRGCHVPGNSNEAAKAGFTFRCSPDPKTESACGTLTANRRSTWQPN